MSYEPLFLPLVPASSATVTPPPHVLTQVDLVELGFILSTSSHFSPRSSRSLPHLHSVLLSLVFYTPDLSCHHCISEILKRYAAPSQPQLYIPKA